MLGNFSDSLITNEKGRDRLTLIALCFCVIVNCALIITNTGHHVLLSIGIGAYFCCAITEIQCYCKLSEVAYLSVYSLAKSSYEENEQDIYPILLKQNFKMFSLNRKYKMRSAYTMSAGMIMTIIGLIFD